MIGVIVNTFVNKPAPGGTDVCIIWK